MNSMFQNVYEQFLEFSPQERISCAKTGLAKTIPYLKSKGMDDNDIIIFNIEIVGLFIGADGKITPNEANVFNKVFGTAFEASDLVAIVSKVTTKEVYDRINKVIDGMEEEVKFAACTAVLAVIAADGEISEDEATLFEDLWS